MVAIKQVPFDQTIYTPTQQKNFIMLDDIIGQDKGVEEEDERKDKNRERLTPSQHNRQKLYRGVNSHNNNIHLTTVLGQSRMKTQTTTDQVLVEESSSFI